MSRSVFVLDLDHPGIAGSYSSAVQRLAEEWVSKFERLTGDPEIAERCVRVAVARAVSRPVEWSVVAGEIHDTIAAGGPPPAEVAP